MGFVGLECSSEIGHLESDNTSKMYNSWDFIRGTKSLQEYGRMAGLLAHSIIKPMLFPRQLL